MHAATSIPGTRMRRKRGRRCNQDLCSLLKAAARRSPRRAEKQGYESKAIYNMPKSENQNGCKNGCNSFCTRFLFVNSGYLAIQILQKHRNIHRKRHISGELWIIENPVLRFKEPGDVLSDSRYAMPGLHHYTGKSKQKMPAGPENELAGMSIFNSQPLIHL